MSVADQKIADGTVTIPSVTAAEAGWLAIHIEQAGKPGPVIGFAAVEAGHEHGGPLQEPPPLRRGLTARRAAYSIPPGPGSTRVTPGGAPA